MRRKKVRASRQSLIENLEPRLFLDADPGVSAPSVGILFKDPSVAIYTGLPYNEIEFDNLPTGEPPPGQFILNHPILEWRDAGNPAPGDYQDWTVNDPTTPGDQNEIWLNHLDASAQTTTTVPSTTLAVDFSADYNDGVINVAVDGRVMAELDMEQYPGATERLVALITGLPLATHTITVTSVAAGTVSDNAHICGAAALGDSELKWDQPPVATYPADLSYGWNEKSVYNGYGIAADDWACTTTDPVTDVTWWGSFANWTEAAPPTLPTSFHMTIWTDQPAGTEPYSHPQEVVWEYDTSAGLNYTWEYVGQDFDPRTQTYEASFRFTAAIPEGNWFYQPGNYSIYWFSVAADYGAMYPQNPFGWMTTPHTSYYGAPGAAVTMWAPTSPHVMDLWGAGAPLSWPDANSQWDLAFQLGTQSVQVVQKWVQPPDLTTMGVDVNASRYSPTGTGYLGADDFLCTSTGPITDITIWGSWWHDLFPQGNPGNVTISLSFHAFNSTNPAIPGSFLWYRTFAPGSFTCSQYGYADEGFMTPQGAYEFPGDHYVFEYDFHMDEGNAFVQTGTPENPMIYWMDVQATTITGYKFGWKSTIPGYRWNKDASWVIGREPYVGSTWQPLKYPNGHPLAGQTMDFAFSLGVKQAVSVVKWSQEPAPYSLNNAYRGWDELSQEGGSQIVADDFVCATTQPVTDIHWWGSFLGWNQPFLPTSLDQPQKFHISVWTNEPAGDFDPFNHPGMVIWDTWADNYTMSFVGWDFDPRNPTAPPEAKFKFDLELLPSQYFYQPGDNGTYWISIAAYNDVTPQHPFGWETRPVNATTYTPAVRVYDPVYTYVGSQYAAGGQLGVYEDSYWDMSFELTTVTATMDYGDTPDYSQGFVNSMVPPPTSYYAAYPTLLGNDGARHFLAYDGVYLGSLSPDAELDGQPTYGADGDDNNGWDDEDGVTIPVLQQGQTADLTVTVAGGGYVDAWIDWNGNGSWADPGEQIMAGWLAADTYTIPVLVPSDALLGQTYARFRINSYQDVGSTGLAYDGEVEDYPVTIRPAPQALDFGDAPDSYGTTLSADGARHIIAPNGPWLGPDGDQPDAEGNGQPHAEALGDDWSSRDDENGLLKEHASHVFDGSFESGFTFQGFSGPLDGTADSVPQGWWRWETFWGGGVEHSGISSTTGPAGAGDTAVRFARPDGGGSGDLTTIQQALYVPVTWYKNVTLSLDVKVDAEDLEAGGWVSPAFEWPVVCEIQYLDSDGNTQVWRHGWYIDPPGDSSGGPVTDPGQGLIAEYKDTLVAQGVWTHATLDLLDELPDAVTITNILVGGSGWSFDGSVDNVAIDTVRKYAMIPAATAGTAVQVQVSGTGGYLDGWVDSNNDGVFDPSERVVSGWHTPGIYDIPVELPDYAIYMSRWRINSVGDIGPTGLAQDGEVEDHEILAYSGGGGWDWGDAPSPYPTLGVNNGAHHWVSASGPYLGAVRPDVDPNGQPDPSALGDDNNPLGGADDEDGVLTPIVLTQGVAGTIQVTVSGGGGYLDGWLDMDGNGVWDRGEQIASGWHDDGVYSISVTASVGGFVGTTFARFRINSQNDLLEPIGPAVNGEVEDYQVTVQPQVLTKKWFEVTNQLPAADGMYNAPEAFATYGGGLILVRDWSQRAMDSSVAVPAPGMPVTHSFGSQVEMEVSTDGGVTWVPVVASVPSTVQTAYLGVVGGETEYAEEMLSLNISGGGLPLGIMIRESPTLASSGQTRAQAVPGGYMVSSFFDIFTEVSLDSGATWIPSDAASHVEFLVDPRWTPAAEAPRDVLPMPNGQWVAENSEAFASGIVIRGAKLTLPTGWMVPPILSGSQTHTFDSQLDFQLSTDGGSTFTAARAPVTMTFTITHSRDFAGRDTYETEVIQVDIAGGDLPSGVFIRESPTEPSRGGVSMVPGAAGIGSGGGDAISSFFDIFTEVTTDGGMTWAPATNGPAHMELQRIAPVNAFPNNLFPSPSGRYTTSGMWFAYYPSGAVITSLTISEFTGAILPPLPGIATSYTFGSEVTFDYSSDGGTHFSWVTAPATVSVQITGRLGDDGVTVYYDTEMTRLDISMPSGVMLRESPTKASLGRTTISAVSGGSGGYQIDSFFDIYTEISHDSGLTWGPTVAGPALVVLEPLPAAPLDFGDAPDDGDVAMYHTLLMNDGARHAIVPGVMLGTSIDAETDGQPNYSATGDDSNPAVGPDDEDGVTFVSTLTQGRVAQIQVVTSVAGYLNAWIDFNGDGTWNGPSENIYSNMPVTAGPNTLAFLVPSNASIRDTYARFRFTTQPSAIGYVGLAPDGEVEDYKVTVQAPVADHDFGDAPDSYGTLRASNGARHHIVQGVFLGNGVDAELDGQPSIGAIGDDTNPAGGVDDEDGVVFNTALIPGAPAVFTFTTSVAGYTSVWIDFDGNGSFNDAGDLAGTWNVPAGTWHGQIDVPVDALIGMTYARVRFSTAPVNYPMGPAPDGEVEDYFVRISSPEPRDFGDAPNSYGTTLAVNGPWHTVSNLFLGVRCDYEADGQPSLGAIGDDTNPPGGVYDEDGVVFNTPLFSGQVATATVTATMPGRLWAWIDYNQDGAFDPLTEQLSSPPYNVVTGPNVITFTVPAGASLGATYARFRISDVNWLGPTGGAPDGEVEDYAVTIQQQAQYDFGDAPDNIQLPGYPTLLAHNGARHTIVPGVFMGAGIDAEPDGQPNGNAAGDDLAGIDDEDGVQFTSALMPGAKASTLVTVSCAGYVTAWIDFNHDGAWGPSEIVMDWSLPGSGSYPLPFDVPATAMVGDTFARFRFSTDNGAILTPTGAALDGEVEDYQVVVMPVPQGALDFGDAPNTYGTTIAANGPWHVLSNTFLGVRADAEPDGQPTATAMGDDNNPPASPSDEDGVAFTSPVRAGTNATVDVTATTPGFLEAWVDFNGNGVFDGHENVFWYAWLNAGVNHLQFAVPADATPGLTFARFRLSTVGGLSSTGGATDGEVEDYRIHLVGASVGGTVYWDRNGNHAFDGPETGRAGWTLYIDANGNGSLDPGEVTTTSGAGGAYQFTDLPAGTYVVREAGYASWAQAAPWPSLSCTIVTPGGGIATGQDFGNAIKGDANGDGIVDQADYTVWYNHYGAGGAVWANGDFNFDALVDQADYTIWYNNYGYTIPAVPPPAAGGSTGGAAATGGDSSENDLLAQAAAAATRSAVSQPAQPSALNVIHDVTDLLSLTKVMLLI